MHVPPVGHQRRVGHKTCRFGEWAAIGGLTSGYATFQASPFPMNLHAQYGGLNSTPSAAPPAGHKHFGDRHQALHYRNLESTHASDAFTSYYARYTRRKARSKAPWATYLGRDSGAPRTLREGQTPIPGGSFASLWGWEGFRPSWPGAHRGRRKETRLGETPGAGGARMPNGSEGNEFAIIVWPGALVPAASILSIRSLGAFASRQRSIPSTNFQPRGPP